MTAQSIIEVEVKDEAFKAFLSLFAKYQDALKGMPGAWAQQGQAQQDNNKFLKQAGDEKKAQQADEAKARAEWKKYEDAQTKAAKERAAIWKEIKGSTADVAKNVASTTKDLLKWTALTGVFSLLGAGAGLFGVNRLAETVSNQMRSARGLGTTYGANQAFNLNYKRYVDPNAMLSGVQGAMADPSKRWALNAMGLQAGQYEGKDPADVARLLIPLVRRQFEQGHGSAAYLNSHGLGELGLSYQDAQRISKYSPGDLAQSDKDYTADKSNMDLSDKTQEAWNRFNTQLGRAAQTIENVFIDGLTPLIDPFTRLSAAVAEALKTILGNKDIGKWMDSLGEGIKSLAVYLTSDEFKTGVSHFFQAIDALGTKLYALLVKVGWIDPGAASGPGAGIGNAGASAGGKAGPMTPSAQQKQGLDDLRWRAPVTAGRIQSLMQDPSNPKLLADAQAALADSESGSVFGQTVKDIVARAGISPEAIAGGGKGGATKWEQTFRAIEKANGLPDGFLSKVYAKESANGTQLSSPAGAQGPFQFMPATSKEYGLKDPYDTASAADAAGRKYKDELRRYNGDIRKAAAAYNWGDGNLNGDIKQYGDQWDQHLPKETKDYVNSVAGDRMSMQANPTHLTPVIIEIHNNTGGSAIVTASQLAAH